MVKSLKYSTNGPSQTKKIGEILAQEIAKTKFKKAAFIIALEGELGSGKTTFLQGFAKGLKIKEKVLSPTFIIMRKFQIPKFKIQKPSFHFPKMEEKGKKRTRFSSPSKFKNFYHIDCYRIGKPKEISDLGFQKIFSSPENIIAIEWADRIKNFLPKNKIVLKFKFMDKSKREIVVKSKND